ncbi:MAG: hypothetical protein ACI93R_004060 [Flavobacteriales bacterium]|jgi:hypothetical protein
MTSKKSLSAKTRRLIGIVLSLTLAACGGGESASPSNEVANNSEGSIPGATIDEDNACAIADATVITNTAFSDISLSAGLCYTASSSIQDSPTARIAGGIAVADYNADGRLDFYATSGRNDVGRLLEQTADGHFTDVTIQTGIDVISAERGAIFVDINRDGWPDLISVQDGPSLLQVFANNGDGSFTDISESTGIVLSKAAFSIAAGDYDLDGDLDLFFAHWNTNRDINPLEFLWQNQGDGTFIDRSISVEIDSVTGRFVAEDPEAEIEYSFTPIFADINNDRYPDILLASDFDTSQVLLNNSGAGFIDITPEAINDQAGMGATVADYDNDGDLDWFVSSIGDPSFTSATLSDQNSFSGNRLYENDGAGNFTAVTDEAGVRQGYWGWGSCFADFNNDGLQDLFVVNGYNGMTEATTDTAQFENFKTTSALLYINNGDGTFTDRATELGVLHTDMGRGLACFDYDRDGDQDMLIANSGAAPTLFRNNTFAQENNFINIRLTGTTANVQGVGARIYVSTAGLEQMVELQLGNNYLSQNPVEAHFGLGTSEQIDTVRIVWPGLEGLVTEMTNVESNQFLVITHPNN